ncbi:MAG: minichromosome maintenance protein MCM [Halobacteriota archaeon]|nr:minichromosome maintenance protein MCM [Halobacteriota archaeon]
MSEVVSIEKWEVFLGKYYKDKILKLATEYPEKRSLTINWSDVDKYDSTLADMLLENPDKVLPFAEEALKNFDLPTGITLGKAHIRVAKLPKRTEIRDLRSNHITKLIALEGLVRKVTEVRPKLIIAAFECQRCEHLTMVPQSGSKYIEPYSCESDACGGRKGVFKLVIPKSEFIDAQKIMIQESPENLRGGAQPQTLDIRIEDDLAGILAPGDRIIATGVLRSFQRSTQTGKSTTFDIFLEGNHMELEEPEFAELDISKEDEEEIQRLKNDPQIYEKVVKSIAPTIYGYEEIKEAMALQLLSGLVKTLPDGSRVRGDAHMLLVGDPGTGKSQLLRYISNLAPKGVYTGGKSATAAGLTATAVKDEFGEGRWALEAGALVLADGGMAAVDELDKMKSEDSSAMHEAMEQQTVSVAKAGIMATLKSRCAILGAANPKRGRFDMYKPLAEQIEMPPTLLSRFDLIFILADIPDENEDREIARHILQSHYAGELDLRARNIGDVSREVVKEQMKPIQPEIQPDLLRKYIAYAKSNIFPIMTEEAREQIIDFYMGLRRQGEGEKSAVPVTSRLLEGLVRLGEASARMRLSGEVTLEDVNRVINIVESSLKQVGIDPETGEYDVDWMVGKPKSQRDKITILLDIIRDVMNEYGGDAPKEEVFRRAEEKGIDKLKARSIIDRLQRDGEITEPRQGIIKLV